MVIVCIIQGRCSVSHCKIRTQSKTRGTTKTSKLTTLSTSTMSQGKPHSASRCASGMRRCRSRTGGLPEDFLARSAPLWLKSPVYTRQRWTAGRDSSSWAVSGLPARPDAPLVTSSPASPPCILNPRPRMNRQEPFFSAGDSCGAATSPQSSAPCSCLQNHQTNAGEEGLPRARLLSAE